MGSELVVGWCDALEPDLDVEGSVQNLPDDRLGEVYTYWTGEMPPEDGEEGVLGEGDWKTATRERLTEALQNVKMDFQRDITKMPIHGRLIVIGGGSSWGDAPEGFDDVLLVFTSGIGQIADE